MRKYDIQLEEELFYPGDSSVAYEISVEYTLALAKKAALKSIIRQIRWWAFLMAALALVSFIFAGIEVMSHFQTTQNFVWLGCYFIVLYAVVLFGLYFRVYRSAKKLFGKFTGNPIITIKFDDEVVTFDSEMGHSELKWKSFDKLYQFHDMWLLFNNPTTYFILPEAKLSVEIKDFIVKKLQENGVKVK